MCIDLNTSKSLSAFICSWIFIYKWMVFIDFWFKFQDKDIRIPHPISSEKLRRLFRSFKVDFPDDNNNMSAVGNLVNKSILGEMVSQINSLSDCLVFSKNFWKYLHPGKFWVFNIHIDRRDGVFQEDEVNTLHTI